MPGRNDTRRHARDMPDFVGPNRMQLLKTKLTRRGGRGPLEDHLASLVYFGGGDGLSELLLRVRGIVVAACLLLVPRC